MLQTETPPYLARLERQIYEDKCRLYDRLNALSGPPAVSRSSGRIRQVFRIAFGEDPFSYTAP